jgi:beta-glucosidase
VYVDGRLAGFGSAVADPGDEVTVQVPLPPRAFQVWGDGGWRTVPGAHRVDAAHDVADVRLTAEHSV